MKKNIGAQLALYPCPVAVIGAMDESKPTWTLVAHMGIIGHDHVLVSLADTHYINKFIKQTKKLSINLVDEAILPKADYVGSVSGANVDKADVFDYTVSEFNTPLINESPVILECSVVDTYITKGFESFICSINATYVEETNLSADGKMDYNTLKPVLFEFPTYEYLKTGAVLGKCLSFKNVK